MVIKSKVNFVIVILMIMIPFFADATVSPRDYVLQLAEKSSVIASEGNTKKVNSEFALQFDMPRFAKKCMIDHWNELTLKQQEDFIELFSQNLRRKLAKLSNKYIKTDSWQYTVGNPKQGVDGEIVVPMQVSANGEKIDFLYFLIKVDDDYKLVDYEVSGALLSRNYRGQFNYMMRKYGFNGMLEKIRKKAQKWATNRY